MSLNSKLRTALSMVFILTTAGAISVTAQTQAAADSSSTMTIASAATTNEPRKAESKKPSTAPSKNKTSEVSRDANNSNASANAPADPPVVPRPASASSDKWQFQLTPYFWLASLHGTTGTGTTTTKVDESFSDIWHSLDFAFMGVVEASKGKLVVLTDVEYVAISDEKATPGPLFSSVKAKIKTFIFDPEVGYRVFDDPDKGAFVDVLGGIRVWHISTDLIFTPGILPGTEVQASRNWVDVVGGLRGKAALSKKVFITGKVDFGGGGSKFTYQLFGGLGYNVNKKVALIFGYRDLDVNYNKNNFVYDMSQRGPIMGMGFKF
jgi:hypothetical protein